MKVNPFYAIWFLENFPLSLYNNVSYHIGVFCSSINSSFTQNPGMKAIFYYLSMSPTMKKTFPGSLNCPINIAVQSEIHSGQMLQYRSSLYWAFFWFSKRRKNKKENWHPITKNKSWLPVLRVITKIRSQRVWFVLQRVPRMGQEIN